MARTLNHFSDFDGRYDPNDFRRPTYSPEPTKPIAKSKLLKESPVLSAAAIYQTFEAMLEVERPGSEGDWKRFQSSQKIAWKTGTSFGFRDAWAVGLNTKYAVGVWVGNADGEGKPGLVGVRAAAPILFDVFSLLPASNWFEQPHDEMTDVTICKKSGYRALDICEVDTSTICLSGLKSKACRFHQLIHVDLEEQYRVNSNCADLDEMKHLSWFVLPPLEAHYALSSDPSYQKLPPFRPDCDPASGSGNEEQPMQLIYPKDVTQIYVPINLDGSHSQTIFKVAHRKSNATIHWHLDNTFLASTTDFHEQALSPSPGKHQLTLVDDQGFRLEQNFEIVSSARSNQN